MACHTPPLEWCRPSLRTFRFMRFFVVLGGSYRTEDCNSQYCPLPTEHTVKGKQKQKESPESRNRGLEENQRRENRRQVVPNLKVEWGTCREESRLANERNKYIDSWLVCIRLALFACKMSHCFYNQDSSVI